MPSSELMLLCSLCVHLAWVADEHIGFPGVWKERSPRSCWLAALLQTGLRTARAPPRILLEVSGPHMMTLTLLDAGSDLDCGRWASAARGKGIV